MVRPKNPVRNLIHEGCRAWRNETIKYHYFPLTHHRGFIPEASLRWRLLTGPSLDVHLPGVPDHLPAPGGILVETSCVYALGEPILPGSHSWVPLWVSRTFLADSTGRWGHPDLDHLKVPGSPTCTQFGTHPQKRPTGKGVLQGLLYIGGA